MTHKGFISLKATIAGAVCLLSAGAYAQENISYQKPSAPILQLADYQRPPMIMMNSKKTKLVYLYRPTYKTLEDLNVEELRLAGLRMDPATNISSSVVYYNNLKLRNFSEQNEREIAGLPANPKIAYMQFSPDEQYLSFTNTTQSGVELYIIDLSTAEAHKLTAANLNANIGSPYIWARDSKSLIVKALPESRAALIDEKKSIPLGPVVSTSDGTVSQNRTYPDLLRNPQDEANFVVMTESELKTVDLSCVSTPFKQKDIYVGMSTSPDGRFIMLTTISKPFSYIVPVNRFPMLTVVYDQKGQLVKEVNKVPLIETMPKGFSSVRTGKRSMEWRSDLPATLVYAVALDGGDQHAAATYRDELFEWTAPFDASPKSFFKTKQRYANTEWTNGGYAVITESWYDTRNVKSFLLNLKNNSSRTIEDRNMQDIYKDPGNFYYKKNQYGIPVIAISHNKALLIGDGFSATGKHPFIDELDVTTLKKKRLFTSKNDSTSELIRDILDIKKGDILTIRQSPVDYPNYFVHNIKTKQLTPLTNFANPFATLGKIHKEVLLYKRKDGVELSGTLYLPEGYNRERKAHDLPLLIWAYPREYKDNATAGQVDKDPNDFTYPYYGSFVYWVTKGYAVLDDASFPIVGVGKQEPNDDFIPQLVADAEAAIDAVDSLGYINREKVAIGGHSYGAFMTANLLTHSKLFACGIARSGAYNRTLTPFGFQSEQRNYWDVPEVYNTMSPFMHADQMNTPMLLVHGEADNNPGTFTLQTERYFQALKNLGKPVRMVLLPKEQHGYVARENILHLLWEQEQFLDKYLKK